MKNYSIKRRFSYRKTLLTILVGSSLSGCSALTGPDRFEIPANTSDFNSKLYVGASFGRSNLSPNTSGSVYSADSGSGIGTQLRLGYDVHNMLAVEFDTSVLGDANLTGGSNVDTGLQYSSASLSALVYGLSGVQMRSRREGLSAYGRIGFSALSRSSSVTQFDEGSTLPILGLGAEYGFANGLGVRAEITRYDSDATFFGLGAVYRFGISPAGIGRMIADAAEPALRQQPGRPQPGSQIAAYSRGEKRETARETIVERYAGPNARVASVNESNLHYTSASRSQPRYTDSMTNRWRPSMRPGDQDTDGVQDNQDSCPDTAAYVTVDRYGCGLFDAVLEEVVFKSGSRWLTPRARKQLDLLAETLLAFPESRIQVRAHTDSTGAADANVNLSSLRAEVVVQYLQSKGVHELQMQAVGMGEAQPLDSNSTRSGRLRNRRVDIVTLPDQDAGHLLVAENAGSARVITVNDTSSGTSDIAVAKDAWNSAPGKRKPQIRPPIQNVVANEPGLVAANPVIAKAPGLPVAALPVPGFAPGFPVTGVVTGVDFDSGIGSLNPDSKNALKKVVQALENHPGVSIAIMAHTDDKGTNSANMELSKLRAKSVVEYIASQGVEQSRLKAEGYGNMLPLVQSISAEDRKRNRRIEVRILPD